MESVIFWTTLSAFLGCKAPHLNSMQKNWMTMLKDNANKFTTMKDSPEWFTIKLDGKACPVYRIVQADESVIFIAEIENRKIKLFRGENDSWIGEAEKELVDKIGRAIEEA